jgi:hypothetical protein
MNVGISVPLPAYNVDVAFMARKASDSTTPVPTVSWCGRQWPRPNRKWQPGWSASPRPCCDSAAQNVVLRHREPSTRGGSDALPPDG